jgi:hypothetical protein
MVYLLSFAYNTLRPTKRHRFELAQATMPELATNQEKYLYTDNCGCASMQTSIVRVACAM